MQAQTFGEASEYPQLTLLIVDDDRAVREACQAIAGSLSMRTLAGASAREGLALMEQTPVDVVLTDLRMPGMDGIRFLEAIRSLRPDVFVIVMSGYGSIESAVESMQKGATAFISKPFRMEELRQTLRRIGDEILSQSKARNLRLELQKIGTDSLLMGRSPEMQQLSRAIKRASSSSAPVLIAGETGTGKELLAKSIHLSVKGPDLPFIPVDCCSLSPELLENELFGHVKGSFPGAWDDKCGLLSAAEGGTVLLNEVSELSIDTQAKLSRALQAKAVRPYGSAAIAPMRARVLATTSRDLSALVAEGKFRQELYYLLSVLVIRLPALRQRREDIPLIVEYFLQNLKQEHAAEKTISPEAMRTITDHDWPGNFRELEAVLQRAYLLATGTMIDLCHLPHEITSVPVASAEGESQRNRSLAEIEREGVIAALRETNGDKQKAAKLLGVSRTTLYRKLHEYKLPS